jgi:hypothetical protein
LGVLGLECEVVSALTDDGAPNLSGSIIDKLIACKKQNIVSARDDMTELINNVHVAQGLENAKLALIQVFKFITRTPGARWLMWNNESFTKTVTDKIREFDGDHVFDAVDGDVAEFVYNLIN